MRSALDDRIEAALVARGLQVMIERAVASTILDILPPAAFTVTGRARAALRSSGAALVTMPIGLRRG